MTVQKVRKFTDNDVASVAKRLKQYEFFNISGGSQVLAKIVALTDSVAKLSALFCRRHSGTSLGASRRLV